MKIGYVTHSGRGLIDDCIAEIVGLATRHEMNIAGTVRSGAIANGTHPCDMNVRVVPDGPVLRVSQALGKGSRGCRLDGSVIEDIAQAVEERLHAADALVINKFGKQEAKGRGLYPVISRAVEMGKPVIIGVNDVNLPSFLEFAQGYSIRLEPDAREAWRWLRSAINEHAETSA